MAADRESIARHLLALPYKKKAWLLSSMIFELTLQARSRYSDDRADGASIMESVEAIHRVCGYLLLILENRPLESEDLLAEMAATLVQDDSGMQKALAELGG